MRSDEDLLAFIDGAPTFTGGSNSHSGNGASANDGEAPRSEQQKEASSPPTTEDAIALAFAQAHTTDLRYVAGWSKWLRWDGARWCYDETLHAFDLEHFQIEC